MARAPHSPSRPGFMVRRLEDLIPRAQGRDWDARFVSATLLFYGLMGTAFFLVDWLNGADEASPAQIATPYDDQQDRARAPYLVRLPQLLKNRDAADTPPELR